MTDKKMNVLDRILCVFRPKKETCPDIIAQAESVIESYIYSKNSLIHRKCNSKTREDKLYGIVAFAAAVILGITVFRILT